MEINGIKCIPNISKVCRISNIENIKNVTLNVSLMTKYKGLYQKSVEYLRLNNIAIQNKRHVMMSTI